MASTPPPHTHTHTRFPWPSEMAKGKLGFGVKAKAIFGSVLAREVLGCLRLQKPQEREKSLW